MEVPCPHCGAGLRLNPNLAGTELACPECGERVTVPPSAPPAPAPGRRRTRRPWSLWLLGAQACIALLGLSCLAGVFLRTGWQPPEWSYFMEPPLALAAAGIALLILGWAASFLPVLVSLGVAVLALGAAAHHYVLREQVDASRALAVALAMLGLWCALQHRRKVG